MNGKWGFISKDEATIIQFKYDDVSHITDSTFIAKINGKYGLLNYTDEFILEPKYDKIIYKIMNKVTDPSYVFLNGKLAILNSKNEFVTNFEYSGEPPYYGLPQEDKYVMISKEVASQYSFDKHRYGLIEYETGNIVIPCEYERLGNIAEGLICAKKNDNYGYIDINNKIVIPFSFNDAEDFSEGLARVAIHGGYYNSRIGILPFYLYGFIDKSGKFIIAPEFDNPTLNSWEDGGGFHEGLAAMGEKPENNVLAHNFGYIDTTGRYIIKPIYEKAHRFMHGVAIVRLNEKYGCIDKNGNIIVDLIYDNYEYRAEKDSVITFKNRDKIYSFHFNGVPVQ